MARQAYYSEAWQKHLEVYQDFSGGMNTTSAQDTMLNKELSEALNVSLDERGSLKRRTGMVNHIEAPVIPATKVQGYFRFYKTAYEYEEIIARDGKLEKNGVQLPITGLADGFQTTRFIEAVQFYDKMYFATGTKLVQYDGTEAKVVEPYAPEPLEALYVGTNALADDPNNFLSDGEGPTLQVSGVTFSSRYGIMNHPFTVTAYHIQKEGVGVEYQFEFRYPFMEDGKWELGQEWSSSKEWTFTAVGEGDMQFRINARDTGKTVAAAQFLVPAYRIKPSPDPDDIEPNHAGIHTCNRIIVHWGRLLLYGDTINFNILYMSHLKNPNYFPVPNNLLFETSKNEPLTAITRFRDHLVAFTDSSIQALFGKSPSDYRRVVLNTSVGCIAPNSVAVMDNYVVFLSAEGVYLLKSVGYVDDKANVSKMDTSITNLVHRDSDACAIVEDDQYHIIFPQKKERFRYYKGMGTWVHDKSESLNITALSIHSNELYGQRENGQIIKFSDTVYTDLGEIYPMVVETKYFDFGQPYHRKKLKELQITADTLQQGSVARMRLFTDGTNHLSEVVEHTIKFLPTEDYNVFVSKIKIKGRALRTKIHITHETDEAMQILGMAIVGKLKKP